MKRFFALFALLLSAPSIARAGDLDCLLEAKGRQVRWDADWQRDRGDMDVPYAVESVQDTAGEGGMREIVLGLRAKAPARLSERTARIRLDHAALMFCNRIIQDTVEINRALSFGSAQREIPPIDKDLSAPPVDTAKLSFRTLIDRVWLPARPAANDTPRVCRTSHAIFACSTEDYRLWDRINTAGSAVFMLKTNLPFIRRTSTGWVRSDPVSSDPQESLSECRVLQRTFSCIAREKHLYGGELRALEQELIARSYQ